MEQKKTKIICTISDMRCDMEFIRSLYENGMNVARINSAHATLEGAQKVVDNIRAVSDRIAILIDTKGPEVRLTAMEPSEGFKAVAGDTVEIHDDPSAVCTPGVLNTTCPSFVADVPADAHVLIDDGSVDLLVKQKHEHSLVCEVLNDGIIKGKKSVNVPNVPVSLPALTEKDVKFVNWAIDADIDFIAHSFVRSKSDLIDIQRILDARKSHIKIISKIENQQGVDNIEEIITHCYGVMVARGDLGVEIAAERIPFVQKQIISHCRAHGKPVIIATQMLHSMIDNPRPTRAEVSDIANAILERTDAIMLSGETASGKYPVEAVSTMHKIAREAEKETTVSLNVAIPQALKPIAVTLARNLVEASVQLPVKAIIFDTWTGRTGRYLAEFRPVVPIYAMCYQSFTMRELALTYGIHAYPFSIQKSKEDMVKNALRILKEDGKIADGDLVGFIGGSFNSEIGATYLEFIYVR